MGMRVGGAGSSAAMDAWQAQVQQTSATQSAAGTAGGSTTTGVSSDTSATDQAMTSLISALASGSTFSKMA